MGQQIIKQPNGKYAVFSSICDGFVYTDGTKKEIIQYFIEEAIENSEYHTKQIFKKLEANKNPYYQFKLTWEEAVELNNKNFPKLEI